MTLYRACVGCAREKAACGDRDTLRAALRGLGVTSIKWRCRAYEPRIPIGSPVWARTVPDSRRPTFDEDSHPSSAMVLMFDFPGVAVRAVGTKMLVYIDDGVCARDIDAVKFSGGPFCKIPLSRIERREGEIDAICQHCERPASRGHAEGYSCAVTP